MTYITDYLWIRSAKLVVQGINQIFTTCPITPQIINVIVHAMWDLCREQTSAPPEIRIAARGLLIRGVWRSQEKVFYEMLLKITGELPASSLPTLSDS